VRRLLPDEPVTSYQEYVRLGGGEGLQRAVELGPAATIDLIASSGLRGRGGGGFPTGRKWRGVVDQPGTRRYVVANGAEGEPGTFKDRTLLRLNPYQVVEGVMIAGFAVGAEEAFVALKASFGPERDAVIRAAEELQTAGLCPDCPLTVVHGPDEYLFGEEKALLEVIEGKPPLPRLLAPFEHGLFAPGPQEGWEAAPHTALAGGSNPTLVNNVETLANVPAILRHGAEWFRSQGTAESPGTVVCTVVGDVVHAGVDEVALGTPLGDVVERVGGGCRPGRSVKAILSGVANAVVAGPGWAGIPVSYEGFAAVGSGMGAAGFIVFDDTACMVEAARMSSQFLHVESCGQCPACKNGSREITLLLSRIEAGEGEASDVDSLAAWLAKVTDGNRCYLAVEEQVLVASIVRAFAGEVDEHLVARRCPRPRPLQLMKLVDIVDGRAVIDERQARKRADWTYAAEDEI